MAGEPDHLALIQPIFDLLGQRTFYVGADPTSANVVKLASNVMTATALEMLGEVLSLVRKRGLDAEMFLLERRHGLNRCRYKGENGMKRWVGLSVISDNLINIGRAIAKQTAQTAR